MCLSFLAGVQCSVLQEMVQIPGKLLHRCRLPWKNRLGAFDFGFHSISRTPNTFSCCRWTLQRGVLKPSRFGSSLLKLELWHYEHWEKTCTQLQLNGGWKWLSFCYSAGFVSLIPFALGLWALLMGQDLTTGDGVNMEQKVTPKEFSAWQTLFFLL